MIGDVLDGEVLILAMVPRRRDRPATLENPIRG